MFGWIGSLIIGGIAGWLAGKFSKGEGYGILINVILGLAGGTVGGWLFGILGLGNPSGTIGRIICATLGAWLIVTVFSYLKNRNKSKEPSILDDMDLD